MKISKTILLSFTAASVLAISSCGDYGKRGDQDKETSNEIENADRNRSDDEASGESDGEVMDDQTLEQKSQVLLNHYISLKNALVNSNAEEAKEIAERMQPVLEKGESSGEIDRINEEVKEIANTDDIEQQREHFHSLSQQMYQLVQNTKANDNEMYWAHCPMALDNKGAYWLSEVKEIRNPYFGDKMMKCGKVSETLVASN